MLVPILILCTFVAVWAVSDYVSYKQVMPPVESGGIREFLDHSSNPFELYSFTLNGVDFFEVIGTSRPRLLSIPSGPPIYIFDRAGRFVEWSRDSGDDERFSKRWGYFSARRRVAREEVQKLTEGDR